MKKNKPKIRKYNKKLKKIDDEETMILMEEELLRKNHLENKNNMMKW